MESNKSPGSDGLSSLFYLTVFDKFGDILTKVINFAFDLYIFAISSRKRC